MKTQTETKLTWGGWGLAAGAAAAMIIGFNWGGWTTRSTTQKMTDEAVLSARAAICVACSVVQSEALGRDTLPSSLVARPASRSL